MTALNEQQPGSDSLSVIVPTPQPGKRRRDVADGEAYDTVKQLRKKQRILADTTSPVTSTGSTTENDGGNTVLQPTASSIDLQQDQPALSVPRKEDSTSEVITKLAAIVDAVRAGKSITGNITESAQSLEMTAESQMPPLEHEAWTTFKQGLWSLPALDWHKNQLPPPTSLKPLKIARRRAEALRRLYKTDQAHEGHVMWVTHKKIEFLHMIKAMARVIGAEKNQVGGGKGQAVELANLQSINRILSISTQICQERKSKVLQSKVAETQQVLGNYRLILRKSVSSGHVVHDTEVSNLKNIQGSTPKLL